MCLLAYVCLMACYMLPNTFLMVLINFLFIYFLFFKKKMFLLTCSKRKYKTLLEYGLEKFLQYNLIIRNLYPICIG
jgi:energy-coupling factor transporter transmembrane protein EcfT